MHGRWCDARPTVTFPAVSRQQNVKPATAKSHARRIIQYTTLHIVASQITAGYRHVGESVLPENTKRNACAKNQSGNVRSGYSCKCRGSLLETQRRTDLAIRRWRIWNRKHLKNLGPIRHCEPFYIAIHQVSPLSHAACASMSTTTTTSTTTTRDRGDRYGPMEWAQ